MASLRDIRKRIKSVKNTQKITRAMKLVSAAKLRRAQQAVEATRPYSDKVLETVSAIAKRAELLGEAQHPLLRQGIAKGAKAELIVMTSDRGLCGGFNTGTVRRALRFLFDEKANYSEIKVATVGRKGKEQLKVKATLAQNFEGVVNAPSYARADEIAKSYCERFKNGELDAVFLVYFEFKGGMQVKQLLPIVPMVVDEDLMEMEYEPSADAVLEKLLPAHFAMQLFRAFLETVAAEHLARMMAMDNATKNASDMVDRLTLLYNRARQASITKELAEIIGGAEAIK
jgi:F-type H+-transporting ATPase subunit gamma